MKTIIFAAALSVSSVAFAQATTDTSTQPTDPNAATTMDQGAPATDQQPSGVTVDDPSQATGPQGVTQQGTDPNGQAVAPPGTNQGMQTVAPGAPMPDQQAAFTPRAATQDYPPCSRTVTDNCIQTYERGVRRPRR